MAIQYQQFSKFIGDFIACWECKIGTKKEMALKNLPGSRGKIRNCVSSKSVIVRV